MEEENHLAQDIGTFRYAGAQGGEVPGQLVKKMFFIYSKVMLNRT